MSHTWKFFRAGGFDQVKLDSGADLAHLGELDQKLWVALACPTRGLEFDSRTLDLIDSDKDGRVRVPEVIAAVKWAAGLLKDPNDLLAGSPSLPLAAINDAAPEGQQILASARQILLNLGKPKASVISLEDAADTAKIFAATSFNGDGIIPPGAADDEATKAAILDIIACFGSELDRSGKPGISQPKADAFFTEAQAHANWWKQAESDQQILPLGDATAVAAAAVKTVQAKVDDYFTRCRFVAFDARSSAAMNRPETDYLPLAARELNAASPEIAGFPLAQVAPGKPLPLTDGLNPAWVAALATFAAKAVKPLIGERNSLSEDEWNSLKARLAPFESWSAAKVGASVEKLGLPRIREILAGSAQTNIRHLIARDKALEPQAAAISAVEKLIRFHRDLYTLCVNFVNFQNFYSRKTPAIFQAGRLYLDQRSCDLCLTVEDAGKHAVMASLAGAYLAYLDCVRKSTGDKLSILAVLSQGDDENLMVGRNGLFYDRKGNDYDATITKIIANPISLRQAFWAPYKKLVRFIEEQVAKQAATADAATTASLQSAASAPAATPAANKIDTGTLAAIGLVLTTLMGALGLIFSKLFGLPTWKIPLVIAGLMLAISLPSVVMAWLQLRKRNLGPILDANGWAVNAKAKMNVPFGASLTQIAALPPGSQPASADPFAEKSSLWPKLILAGILCLGIVFGLWYFRQLDGFISPRLQPSEPYFFGTNAWPASAASTVSTNGPVK